jgi:hypothetical protein
MKALYTRYQAASTLEVSAQLIDYLITIGHFKVFRIGRLVLIPFTQIGKFDDLIRC